MVVRAGGLHALDQNLDRPPHPGPIALESDSLLEREQLVEPAPLLGRGDVVGQARRRGAGSRREGCREDLVVADRAQQLQAALELGLGLAAEADDDVRGEADAGDGGPQPLHEGQVRPDRVLAAHAVEHGVVARLDRQVEVLADRRALCDGVDEAIGEVPGMGGDEAQARDRRRAVVRAQTVDGAQQRGDVRPTLQLQPPAESPLATQAAEARLGRQVVAVLVDVLTEQRHLAVAGRGERPRLADDLIEGPAALCALRFALCFLLHTPS